MVNTKKLNFNPLDFESAEKALAENARVYFLNPKKKTSLAGFITQFLNRDEGKEIVLFRSNSGKRFRAIPLSALYLTEEK